MKALSSIFAAALLLLLGASLCQAKPAPADYQAEAAQILAALAPGQGPLSGQAWNRLAELTDTVGNRVSGSDDLRRAVAYMLDVLRGEDGLERIDGEPVVVPHWVRGREEGLMLAPRHGYRLNMLGLGGSVGTVGLAGGEGGFAPVVADVIVVADWAELEARGAAGEVEGKIVLLNPACDWAKEPIGCYGQLSQYRGQGASRAAPYGAVACLVRSLASSSIGSAHTGMQSYAANVKPIPAAAVAVEDADAMARMQARGQRVTVSLYMEAQNLPPEPSHNVVAEWRGSERPEEVVILSGHLDSWDVGVGAMDDGGGVAIAWQALSTLRSLGLRAKRTVRLVLWSSEEFGGVGARQYYERHKGQAGNLTLVVESDIGAFRPTGLSFTGSASAAQVMQEVLRLLAPINASALLVNDAGYETDTAFWERDGVPGASLASRNERYFAYHHSNGDQMSVLDPGDMDLAAAVFAVVAFVVADLDAPLARNDATVIVAAADSDDDVNVKTQQGLLRGAAAAVTASG